MDVGDPPLVGTGNSVITPAGVIFPILFPKYSPNHRLPSGPAEIPYGPLAPVWIGYSVNVTWAWHIGAANMRARIHIREVAISPDLIRGLRFIGVGAPEVPLRNRF